MKVRRGFLRRSTMSAAAVVLCCTSLIADSSTGGAVARESRPNQQMIVMLRAQNGTLRVGSAARRAAINSEQAPIVQSLRASGATHIVPLSLLNAVIATMSVVEAHRLENVPAVSRVMPDSVIPGPIATTTPAVSLPRASAGRMKAHVVRISPSCGTESDPQLNPEALTNINATPSQLGQNIGSGVTVAFLADGIDTSNPDFQRNAAYGVAGAPVVSQYDFSGGGTSESTPGGEAFGDASSIAAQGNTAYDLSQFVSPANPLPANCDIKIVGVAPGANVEALKVFATSNDTTASGFLQAINYAVASGAKVINESFGAANFPDTSLDITRQANDAAVAAGVTVVVSSGDSGNTSTIGSPASDPNVISVGASTTFRSYGQLTYGGINDPNATGATVDNNISSLSSGGFTQAGNTVDLVAPGDLNWALCDANISQYFDCRNENGVASPIEIFGGTSESAPLTAGAAADVIAAYASTHNGVDPSPALVKQILMSTASDIGAPATQQGAGLLNVLAAVNEAKSIPALPGKPTVTSITSTGLLINPGQINVVQSAGQTSNQNVQFTNTGSSTVTVGLSTRALATTPVATQTGSFCLNPTGDPSCPVNSGTFAIWNGANETYQDVNFTVPSTGGLSRLKFSADYQNLGQTYLLHFALIEPNGSYAAYSLPQGLGDYGEVEVTNPPAGEWTAVFFTLGTAQGTRGPIQWSANTFTYDSGSNIVPSTLILGPGQTGSAQLSIASSNVAGDTSQSIVVASPYGTTTVPVTLRTMVPMTPTGGTFSGILTGGNGRGGGEAATNSYSFAVPSGLSDLDINVVLANDPQDFFIAELVDPNGQTVSYNTNVTQDSNQNGVPGLSADLYAVNPIAGQWSLILDWLNPVSGAELSEPFSGTIMFNHVSVTNNLPVWPATFLAPGTNPTFNVTVTNTGTAPKDIFLDPRLNQEATIGLVDENGQSTNMALPLPAGLTFPTYEVPPLTSQLQASIAGSAPVTFDLQYFPGDPDVAPGVNNKWVTAGSISGNTASVTLSEPQVSPGMWFLNPAEIGPYPATGAPPVTASASLNAVTRAFNPSMTSSTGDFWSYANGIPGAFSPIYLAPGASVTIPVTINVGSSTGKPVQGTLYVEDFGLGAPFVSGLLNAQQLAAIPYGYNVSH